MKRIGIYPGSFDPVHEGHMAFAKESLSVCGLDGVVFLPESNPRGKAHVSPLPQRLKNLRLATESDERLHVLYLPERQFTVIETLPALLERFPNTHLTLLVGSDIIKTFSYRWPGLNDLLRSVELAIGLRGDDTTDNVKQIMSSLQGEFDSMLAYSIITTPYATLSSSQLR